MQRKLIYPLALLFPFATQAGDLLAAFTFDDQTLAEAVSGQSNFETQLPEHSGIADNNGLSYVEIESGKYALEVENLRFLRIPLSALAQSGGQFTIKYDYYPIASKTDGGIGWNVHSFAMRDLTNNFGWTHGYQKPDQNYWSANAVGFTTNGAQIKNTLDGYVVPKLTKETWHEYVLVFDGTKLTWYVNGVWAYEQTFTESFATWDFTNADIMLGARYENDSVDTLMGMGYYPGTTGTSVNAKLIHARYDDVKIWDGALSAEIIANDVDTYAPVAPYTQLEQATYSVNSIDHQITLNIDSNEDWTLSGFPGWISASQTSGNGSATITLDVAENALDEARQSILTLNDINITVSQSAFDERDKLGAVIIPKAGMQTIDYVFFDLKSHWGDTMSDEKADQLFIDDGFNGVRTSIYGTQDKPDEANGKPAHPGPGDVIGEYYAPEIQKIKQALARNPELRVFASKKLNGQYSFPDWVMQGSGIIPEQYAIMLADYIRFMAKEGIPTHYLGIDNEYVFNEGYIWPDRFRKVVDALKVLAADEQKGFEMPIIVGYEDYSPGRNDWMKKLVEENGWGDRMDLYGTHYYPEDRTEQDVAKLKSDLSYNGYKDRWHTELHWDSKAEVEDILEVEDGLGSLLDMTDHGFNGLMWWAYSNSGLRGSIMRDLTSNLLGYQPIMMLDHDGVDILQDGKVHTRAFRKGNKVIVWALNLNAEKAYSGYRFSLATSQLAGAIEAKQWTESQSSGASSSISATEQGIFSFDLPTQSVTSFSFELAPEQPIGLVENFEGASDEMAQGAGTLSADINWEYDFSAPETQAQTLDSGRPFAGKHLQLSATEGTVQLTHTLDNNAILLDDSNTTLKFKLMLNSDVAAEQSLAFKGMTTNSQQLLNVSLVTDAQQQASLMLTLNQSESLKLADLGLLNLGEVYDVTVSLNRAGDNQTDVYYTLYRNQMFWLQGQTFTTQVLLAGTEVNQFAIHSTGFPLSLDEISLQFEKAAEPIAGDLSGNLALDAEDLVLLRSLIGKSSQDGGYTIQADLDLDGQISRRDYALLFAQLRQQ